MILAGVGILVAGFFLLQRDFNKAFVIATLGMVAWFLNYRAQLREITAAADLEEERKRLEKETREEFR
jgi:hypothetical protein